MFGVDDGVTTRGFVVYGADLEFDRLAVLLYLSQEDVGDCCVV